MPGRHPELSILGLNLQFSPEEWLKDAEVSSA
jgi:hypothetical protein